MTNPAAIIAEITRCRGAIRVVSFDVFDTAVVRPVAHPHAVFDLVQREYERRTGDELGLSFRALRVRAEGQAIAALPAAARGAVAFAEIYAQLEAPGGPLAGARARALAAIELELEENLAAPHPQAVAAFRHCRALGLPVVFASDMYLPQATIARILDRCGFAERQALYVSGTVRRSKAAGDLFGHIAADAACSPAQILHIGDHLAHDVEQARSQGCRALHTPYPGAATGLEGGPGAPDTPAMAAWAGLVRRRRLAAGSGETPSAADFWWWLGYERAGILFLGFTQWLGAELTKCGAARAVFLARDGHVLRRVYDRVAAERATGEAQRWPPSAYLFASRRMLNVPALAAIDDGALDTLTHSYTACKAGAFFARLGIDPGRADVAAALRGAGLRSARQPIRTAAERSRLREAMRAVGPEILALAAAERRKIQAYLRGAGMLEPAVTAVIDIGWHGTLQASLARLVGPDAGAKMRGFYLGTFREAGARMSAGAKMAGYLCDRGEPAARREAIGLSVAVFEFLCSAPHGSVIGLAEDAGAFRPVCEAPAWEPAKAALAARAQDGACAFVDDFLALQRLVPALAVDACSALHPLYRVLADPTPAEAAALGDLPHGADFGVASAQPIAARRGRLVPRLFRRRGAPSAWRRGEAVRHGERLPPLPPLGAAPLDARAAPAAAGCEAALLRLGRVGTVRFTSSKPLIGGLIVALRTLAFKVVGVPFRQQAAFNELATAQQSGLLAQIERQQQALEALTRRVAALEAEAAAADTAGYPGERAGRRAPPAPDRDVRL